MNPDFTSQFRSDLEFFIPELCSFYIKGDFEQPKDLVNLIVMASSSSFFFSHRAWFFFQSLIMIQDEEGKEAFKKSSIALRGIKDVCVKSKERLYLANSSLLQRTIRGSNLRSFYSHLWPVDPSNPYLNQVEYHDETRSRIAKAEAIIMAYSENHSLMVD